MVQYIGLDIHRKFIQVCVMSPQGDVLEERRLSLQQPDEVYEFFAQFPGGETQVVMEATVGWMWLADLLESLAIEVHLAHMQGVRVIAESRCKTDKIDARTLAQLLRTDFLAEAYLAPREVRDRRMVLRHRQGLIGWRTSAKNKVHALLARYNIHIPAADIFGAEGRRLLKALELPPAAARIMSELLRDIDFFTGQIEAVEKRLSRHMKPDPRVALLQSIPGVGKLTAYYLISEIGRIERFRNPRKLATYCGLSPSTRESASVVRHGGTKGTGRCLLKWALVEAAHTAVRRDSYFARVFHRIAQRRGKGKAYVAVARKMAQIVWMMLTEQRPYISKVKYSQVGSRPAVTVKG